MAMIFYLTLLLVATLVRSRSSEMLREDSGSSDRVEKEETVAYETYGSPSVYGTSNILQPGGFPLNGKSTYNYPLPQVSPFSNLPASYVSYLTGQGLGNPYTYGSYNRYGYYPYTASSLYGYGAPVPNALGYGASTSNTLRYGSANYGLPGLGYTGYGSSFFRRSPYSDAFSYPGYGAGLGYRYGGIGYPPAGLVDGPVVRASAPVIGLSAPVSRVPAPVAAVPGSVAAFSAPLPGVPVPIPAASPYGPQVRPVQGKDGSLRYEYAPSDVQTLRAY